MRGSIGPLGPIIRESIGPIGLMDPSGIRTICGLMGEPSGIRTPISGLTGRPSGPTLPGGGIGPLGP